MNSLLKPKYDEKDFPYEIKLKPRYGFQNHTWKARAFNNSDKFEILYSQDETIIDKVSMFDIISGPTIQDNVKRVNEELAKFRREKQESRKIEYKCSHVPELKVLFTSTYTACKKCGQEC